MRKVERNGGNTKFSRMRKVERKGGNTKFSRIRKEAVRSYCVGNLITVLHGSVAEFVTWVPRRRWEDVAGIVYQRRGELEGGYRCWMP